MNPNKVVVHVVDRQRRGMVLNLLAEGVRQPGKTAVHHANGEVLAFDVTGVDVLRVRTAFDGALFAADALRRAVALLTFNRVAVDLDEHGIVDIVTERGLDRSELRLQSISGELYAIGETAREIFHEQPGRVRVTHPEHEGRHQLSIGADSNPG